MLWFIKTNLIKSLYKSIDKKPFHWIIFLKYLELNTSMALAEFSFITFARQSSIKVSQFKEDFVSLKIWNFFNRISCILFFSSSIILEQSLFFYNFWYLKIHQTLVGKI